MLVILLLVGFLAVFLTFVTLRQLRVAQAQSLRLLATLAERVEEAVPIKADRLQTVVRSQSRGSLKAYLDQAGMELVGEVEPSRREPTQPASLHTTVTASTVTFTYVGPLFDAAEQARREQARANPQDAAVEPPGDESVVATERGEEPLLTPTQWEVTARFRIDELLAPVLLPDVFESLLIADATGEVLFQQGNRELRVARLDHLLRQAGDDSGLVATLAFWRSPSDRRSGPGSLPSHTSTFTTQIAGTDHLVFAQPVHVLLPAGSAPADLQWTICGTLSQQRLLSESFTTSPFLLFVMISIFPAALISWPFLKLWLISPRQNVNRLDVAALVIATLLGCSLLTFAVLDLLVVERTEAVTDQQLGDLAAAVETSLRFELADAYRQLLVLATDEELRAERMRSTEPAGEDAPSPVRRTPLTCSSAPDLDLGIYPYFHAFFWMDPDGRQQGKIPLRTESEFQNNVADRGYFQAIFRPNWHAPEGPNRHTRRTSLVLDDDERRAYLAEWRPTGIANAFQDRPTVVQAIRSKTDGADLAVVAVRRDEEPHAALTMDLLTFREPPLPQGFGFALVASDGTVLFHSDRRRSLNENLLKATGRSTLLASMLRGERRGSLDSAYRGQRHRFHVEPVDDLDAALVTFRSLQPVRVRHFELIYDFFNAYGLYLLLLALVLLAVLLSVPEHYARYLWPGSRYRGAYRLLVVGTVPTLTLFALLLAWDRQHDGPRLVFWASWLLPFATVVASGYLLRRAEILCGLLDRERLRGVEVVLLSMAATFGAIAAPSLWGWSSPEGWFLLALATILGVQSVRRRRNFQRGQRRIAYTFALTCLLSVLSVLPAIGFFTAARSRQAQIWTQTLQDDLLQGVRRQERHISAQREGDDRDCWFESYDRGPRTSLQDRLVASFQESTWTTIVPSTLAQPAWSYCDQRGVPEQLLSGRTVPLDDLSRQPTNVDLTRYDRDCTWGRRADGRLVAGEPRSGREEAEYLVSRPLDLRSLAGIGAPPTVVVLVGWWILLSAPWLAARFIARRVLLIGLVEPEHGTVSEILAAAARDQGKRPERILLVTSVPDLAIRGTDDRFAHLDFSVLTLAGPAFAKKRAEARESGKPVLVIHFRPEFDDARVAGHQMRRLQELVAEEDKTVVLVSRVPPRRLAERWRGNDAVDPEVHRRWTAYLASFIVRYGRDAGDAEGLRRAVIRRWRNRGKHLSSVDDPRRKHAGHLLAVLYKECRSTRHLQSIGHHLLQEVDLETSTIEQLLSKITHLAHSYYLAIWGGCSDAERVVLSQVARDGVMNPKNLDHALELMQKGLLVREPEHERAPKASLVLDGPEDEPPRSPWLPVLHRLRRPPNPALRLINRSFTNFVRHQVKPEQILTWEAEDERVSTWSVLKWLIPVPLFLLGGFLFVTQRDALTNALGVLVAVASLLPILVNLYREFRQLTGRPEHEPG
ncbi:MAG TPA: cache domain-containing protein [Thermoanaerobaculia bacterium]|nr:cache domain-containing protein [Thermoanaerobaculia bacterium]